MLEGVEELGENEVKFEATKGDVVKKQAALLMTSEDSRDIELSLKEKCRFASNVVLLSVCSGLLLRCLETCAGHGSIAQHHHHQIRIVKSRTTGSTLSIRHL